VSLEDLVTKYIASAERALGTIKIADMNHDQDNVIKIIESAKAYLADAKYYRNQQKFEVSLTSVAYCEGLLDALRLLGAVKFEWPITGRKEREK